MSELRVELDDLSPAERRDLANALLRAAWSAALAETRVRLLDMLVEVDEAVLGASRDSPSETSRETARRLHA